MDKLKLKCKPLDSLLGGGIESSSITEIYGEPGSGKTNFCLQASRECSLNGKKVAYVDCEGVSLERLKQICIDQSFEDILENILFFNPSSFEEQKKMINNAIKINNLGLIVLDTFNMFYRLELESDELGAIRSLNRQIADLQIASRKNDLYVIITGQVYSVENDDVKPFAGLGIRHMSKTIIKLQKTGLGKRQAIIMKHRSQPEGKKTSFQITSTGLE